MYTTVLMVFSGWIIFKIFRFKTKKSESQKWEKRKPQKVLPTAILVKKFATKKSGFFLQQKRKSGFKKEGGQSIIFLVVKLWSTIVNFFVYNFGGSIMFLYRQSSKNIIFNNFWNGSHAIPLLFGDCFHDNSLA